jgi:hypothetical protein
MMGSWADAPRGPFSRRSDGFPRPFRQSAPISELHHQLKRRRTKHDQGFDGPAQVTKVSVNLKIDVKRVRLNFRKSGLGAAYRARVSRLEHERSISKTHVLSLRPTLVRCGLRTLDKVLLN